MLTITFPDGKKKSFKKGITPLEIAKSISEGLAREVVAAKVNGRVIDATLALEHDAELKLLKFGDPEGLEVFRHSSAHLLAQAVMGIFPYAKLTIGPVVEEGFYYDMEHEPFTPEDLEKIEKRMHDISERRLDIKRIVLKRKQALDMFRDNPYKIELINEMPKNEEITAYQQGEFIDLCRGPHVPNTGMLKACKLTKIAGAYWRADAKNKQLQRIYGISFPDKKQLKEYLAKVEEAAKRDHKKIGRELGLFMLSELIGKGLPVWLPKGEAIIREVEKFAIAMEKKYGYMRVSTPHLGKEELFLKSGHLPHYEKSMYPKMAMDDGTYYLKAMNCPMHHLIFAHTPKSYRDLPYRIAEYGTVYRNELSGTLSGLLRVRMLSMNDAHIYCTKEQIAQEIEAVFRMIKEYYGIFGFKDYYFRLSLWNPANKEKYIDEPKNWEYAESQLRSILKKLKLPFVEANDEAAFYGPKVDIQFKTVIGREETMSTVQLDFAAKDHFQLKYAAKDGTECNDVFVIHRAPLSTHERFTAFLIEHYGGKFPLWLSPVQVRILTIANAFDDYAKDIMKQMEFHGIRVELDNRPETIGRKVREAQLNKVNYILVIGEKEEADGTVSVRTRDNIVHGAKKADIFIAEMVNEIKERR